MICYIVYKEKYIFSKRSPGIQGMAFGINKTFFQSLGGFDLGMKVWGAEQFELSIKVSQILKLNHFVKIKPIILNENRNIRDSFIKNDEKANPSQE